jgi:hypothetical protein
MNETENGKVVLVGGPLDGQEYPVDAKTRKIVFTGSIPLLSIAEQEAAGLFMVSSHDPRWDAYRSPDCVYVDTGRRNAEGRRVFAPES